jgi:hypothetical protein
MLPKMIRVRQKLPAPRLNDVAGAVTSELQKLNLGQRVKPGETVAITCGSRGIANIAIITQAIVDFVRSLGAVPIIIPAMGSHGGATAAGQLAVLAEYGITPTSMNCEIRASMETVVVAHTPQGVPIHFDAEALKADHVFVCNRVKPHTMFVGEIESGLHKMLLIGLGKHEGAKIYHRAIVNFSFMEIITAVAEAVIAKCRVLGGLAIVENSLDETALVEGIQPAAFFDREKALLIKAKEWLPRLPFREAHLLIIDRMGKTPADLADIKRIFVRDLTPETHGNASGMGIAEFTTQRLVDKIDWQKTHTNCLTAGHPTGAMLPMVFPNDRLAIEAALDTVGYVEPHAAKVIQIADTLHLEEVLVSEAYLAALQSRSDLTQLSEPMPMQITAEGHLADVFGQ